MPTNDERRDVARKLRELTEDVWYLAREWEEEGIFTNGQDQTDYYQIHLAIFGTLPADHMHPCDYDELHKRLADLIEPEPERKAKARPFPVEKDTGYFDTTKCECGYLNDVSATYCGQCGGVIEVVE